ncbi:uncharacterized protein MELLADRAFT_87738 [Melampsora larici-populina 98AG31]|uniref:Uncharacterized protein n=1 Tax=Melampsora larici-populina (strain 98AG31 / pathotype 3-4-7) TaxID=747676 RepID=F4RNW5_MELLP|nr:uncharacterized protein MELLADRAFT_87738 [Melampsora larici-populina 98AG31]EGG05818.1 hypothetical protein MELLADRAFT_87738 [Melampsora larici-populina 98AG31]
MDNSLLSRIGRAEESIQRVTRAASARLEQQEGQEAGNIEGRELTEGNGIEKNRSSGNTTSGSGGLLSLLEKQNSEGRNQEQEIEGRKEDYQERRGEDIDGAPIIKLIKDDGTMGEVEDEDDDESWRPPISKGKKKQNSPYASEDEEESIMNGPDPIDGAVAHRAAFEAGNYSFSEEMLL